MLHEAVQRGDSHLPIVEGKFVHISVTKGTIDGGDGAVDLWLGSGQHEAQRITRDDDGNIRTVVRMDGNTIATQRIDSGWSDKRALNSPDVAWRLTDAEFWGFHRSLLSGTARVVQETEATITVRPDDTEQVSQAVLDRDTRLPLVIDSGEYQVTYQYQSIEIQEHGPEPPEAPPVQSTTRQMSLAEATEFSKFPLYYVGQTFAGHDLGAIQHTFQDLQQSRAVDQVGFFYRPEGKSTGDAPICVTVWPKSAEVLEDLEQRAASGLVGRDGDIDEVATGHTVMLAVLEDAVVWLYGPDEAAVQSMRSELRKAMQPSVERR